MSVAVVNYGAGNLFGVLRALRAVGLAPKVVASAKDLPAHDRVVLPGVGAFATAAGNLERSGLGEAVLEHVARERPLLGLCLGAQLLMDGSEEFGWHDGLGVISGRVVAIEPGQGLRVPHVGWAPLEQARSWRRTLLGELPPDEHVYFTHSFVCEPEDDADVLARFSHGSRRFVAAVARGSVVGLQFHPELSAAKGLSILRAFGRQ